VPCEALDGVWDGDCSVLLLELEEEVLLAEELAVEVLEPVDVPLVCPE
jgi:hypothetical protein